MYYYYYYYVIKTKTVWRVWLNNQTGCCYKITADIHNTWNERTSQVHCGIQYCTVWADYIVSILENAVDRSAFLCIQKICILLYVHNIYWMNEWCIYIALYCVLLYTQSALQSCRGSLLNHHQCAASTWVMRRLPQDNAPVRSPHTSYRWRGERDSYQVDISTQSSGWGLLGGHDWQGPVKGIWPGHRDYTPTLYEKCHGIFNDHRESGPRFNVSSEGRCFFTV